MYSPWLWDSIKFQAFPKLAAKTCLSHFISNVASRSICENSPLDQKKSYCISGSDCFIQQSTEYKLVDSWNLTTLLVLPLSVSLFNRQISLESANAYFILLSPALAFYYSVSYLWKELLACVVLIHIIKILFALISNWFYYSQ